MNTATEADDAIQELRLLAKLALAEWMQFIVDVIKEGQQDGEFNQKLSPQETSQFLIATIEGAIMMGKLTKLPKLMEQIGDQLLHYIETVVCK